MVRGWFDLFRDNGGPTLYAYSNRTSVICDVQAITLYIAFSTLLVAFLVVFPGIRKEKFTTFTSIMLSLFVGVSILLGNFGSSWHTAEGEISSAYRSFSNEKIYGHLGIYIGLNQVNITLQAMPVFGNSSSSADPDMDVNFNERFVFVGPSQLQEEYQAALVKGLPFPILTVAEYLSVEGEGFCWGRSYRAAGYFASISLWSAFAMWVLMNILLVMVPCYGAYMMVGTGLMMLFTNLIYYLMLPERPLYINLENMVLSFELGWCFWLVLTAGALCVLVGTSITIIDIIYPHKFSTILEMDYGTPFDRHTIIEDSHETKKKKKWMPKLEEPTSVGIGGLLRRLSKRDKERVDIQRNPSGEDNYAFEMDAPKSPWRYPHLMFRDSRKHKMVSFKRSGAAAAATAEHSEIEILPGGAAHRFVMRTDSKESTSSSLSSMPHYREDLRHTVSVPSAAAATFHKKFHRTDSAESSNSSLMSFGLSSLLSRNNSKQARSGLASHPPQPTRVHHHHHHHQQQQQPDDGGNISITMYGASADVEERAAASVTVMVSHNSSGSSSSSSNGGGGGVGSAGRKNSATKAVRRNSSETKRDEASMW